jgi:hypothetical protein
MLGSRFGAILHQGARPLAFFGKQIVVHHAKLAAYKRKLIRLVYADCHLRPYLWGRAFIVRTDHVSLKYLLDQKLATIQQYQWASKLLGSDFRVEYMPGSSNIVANNLSHHDTEATTKLLALSTQSFHLFSSIR